MCTEKDEDPPPPPPFPPASPWRKPPPGSSSSGAPPPASAGAAWSSTLASSADSVRAHHPKPPPLCFFLDGHTACFSGLKNLDGYRISSAAITVSSSTGHQRQLLFSSPGRRTSTGLAIIPSAAITASTSSSTRSPVCASGRLGSLKGHQRQFPFPLPLGVHGRGNEEGVLGYVGQLSAQGGEMPSSAHCRSKE
ncbi:uncharacterized protein LOC112268629 [Brachypodium distachyon]|uniref:uncharacterized protein LOC112268629 n=1 Tax=Brachypodium distachyon TaxID=15368 RepID=UPI000D0C9B06|nr:uncharacterized protein LOC112268629 [Brachypodium distachyon]|eukprot:XP_024310292.1 uncharacterized protein LOC112268629 [Brachypodium distachyon]